MNVKLLSSVSHHCICLTFTFLSFAAALLPFSCSALCSLNTPARAHTFSPTGSHTQATRSDDSVFFTTRSWKSVKPFRRRFGSLGKHEQLYSDIRTQFRIRAVSLLLARARTLARNLFSLAALEIIARFYSIAYAGRAARRLGGGTLGASNERVNVGTGIIKIRPSRTSYDYYAIIFYTISPRSTVNS